MKAGLCYGCLTRAVLGGGRFYAPPPQVFREYLKNGGAQRRRFWYTCSYIISAHVVKISDLGRSRSGHQVTSSDLTSEKVQRLAIATPTERSLWNFQRLIWVTVCIKCISRIFDICDLRSGQFCDLSIISQWEKIEMRLFWTNIVQNALKHRFIGKHDTLNRKNAPVTPLCAPEVISGHERSPAVFWL